MAAGVPMIINGPGDRALSTKDWWGSMKAVINEDRKFNIRAFWKFVQEYHSLDTVDVILKTNWKWAKFPRILTEDNMMKRTAASSNFQKRAEDRWFIFGQARDDGCEYVQSVRPRNEDGAIGMETGSFTTSVKSQSDQISVSGDVHFLHRPKGNVTGARGSRRSDGQCWLLFKCKMLSYSKLNKNI